MADTQQTTTSTAGAVRVTRRYQRERDLPTLLPLVESEYTAGTLAQHAALVGRLRRALRRERCNGLAGHWTYDLGRHAALLAAYRSERDAMLRRQAARCDTTGC